MLILKFSCENDIVTLDKYTLKNISKDSRTSLIDTKKILNDKFKISKNIFISENNLFFTLSKKFTNEEIHAMLLEKENNKFIFVPSKSCIFFNGSPVDVEKYPIPENIESLLKLL